MGSNYEMEHDVCGWFDGNISKNTFTVKKYYQITFDISLNNQALRLKKIFV